MKNRANSIFLCVAALLLSAFTLTSCNEDDEYLAELLRNCDWQGMVGAYYKDRWGITGDEYQTVMRFTSNTSYATSGRGEELDYSINSRSSYAYCTFKWFIVDGEITLIYDDAVWSPIYIVNYSLYNSRFSGYIDDGSSRRIRFDFDNAAYSDWGYYRTRRGSYGDFSHPNYFYAPEREADGEQLFIDRSQFCTTDDGSEGRSILSGDFARAYLNSQQ